MKNKMRGDKRGQEEMIGFALIVIIVAVILLVFLVIFLRSEPKEPVESYEVESFMQAFLQYTSDCDDGLEYLSVQKLIMGCENSDICLDEREECVVLEDVLEDILEESWDVGEERPVKGYELRIIIDGDDTDEKLIIEKGNITANYKGASQLLPDNIDIYFTIYN